MPIQSNLLLLYVLCVCTFIHLFGSKDDPEPTSAEVENIKANEEEIQRLREELEKLKDEVKNQNNQEDVDAFEEKD